MRVPSFVGAPSMCTVLRVQNRSGAEPGNEAELSTWTQVRKEASDSAAPLTPATARREPLGSRSFEENRRRFGACRGGGPLHARAAAP